MCKTEIKYYSTFLFILGILNMNKCLKRESGFILFIKQFKCRYVFF